MCFRCTAKWFRYTYKHSFSDYLNVQVILSRVFIYSSVCIGTPLQYSCLENPLDGGAWWAAVHGVAKSQIRLSDFTFTFHFHALGKDMALHSSVLAWRIPGTGEPGGLPSMGSHRVGHDWSDLAAAAVCVCHRFCILNNPSKIQHKYISDKSITVNTIFCFFFQLHSESKSQNSFPKPKAWTLYTIKSTFTVRLSIYPTSIYLYIYICIKREKKFSTRGK